MLSKQMVQHPQFINVAEKLILINKEKAKLASEFAEFHKNYFSRLHDLVSKSDQLVEEFNLLYGEIKLNVGDG